MRPYFFILPFLIQAAVGQEEDESRISVEPSARIVVRHGETVTLDCVTKKPVLYCNWLLEVPGAGTTGFLDAIPAIVPNIKYRETNKSSRTDCSIIIDDISDKYNGRYKCKPYYDDGLQEGTIFAEVIVAKAPESVAIVGDHGGQRELMVTTEQPVMVTCRAERSRPAAELVWYLGETQLQVGVADSVDEVDADAKLVNTVSNLTHSFRRVDDGSKLRCEARHKGYEDDAALELREDVRHVMVQYAPYRPEGDVIGILYGYAVDQDNHVTINFTANPPPTEMIWTLGDGAPLTAGEMSDDGRLIADTLEEVDASVHRYALTLRMQPVRAQDKDVPLMLRLRNDVGEAVLETSLGTGAPPPPPSPAQEASIGGGAIAGIIIAVLLLLLIVALVAFARSRGKWCFAAPTSDSRAEADTESAHDEKSDKPEKKSFKLSNLYSSLVPKKKELDAEAGDNKEETAGLTAPEGEQPAPGKKEGEVVYAELVLDKDGLKTEIRPSPDKTEYAVIVGTKKEEEGEKKE